MSKIAFLFLTRGDLNQPQFWKTFFQNASAPDQYNIYNHPKNPSQIPTGSILKGRTIPNVLKKTKWGDLSLVKATLRLLRHAYRADSQNQKFILLSESCIPIRSFEYIHQSLDDHKLSYIWSYNLKMRPNQKAIGRRYKNFTAKKLISKKRYRNQSQWMILDRHHVKVILENSKGFLKHFTKVNIPDEVFFINLLLLKLSAHEFKTEIVNKRKTYKVWDVKNSSHPITYQEVTPEKIEQIQQEEGEDYYFMRKVSPKANLGPIQPLLQSKSRELEKILTDEEVVKDNKEGSS